MENNKFEWTDNSVLEFLTYQSNEWPQGAERRKALEEFKKSKEPVPEWEILYSVSVHDEIHPYNKDCIKIGCKIHSVKRLSDGEVFTIGDTHKSTVKFRLDWPPYQITGFEILKDGMAVDNSGNSRNPLAQIEKVKDQELQWFVIPQSNLIDGLNKGWTPIKQRIGNMGGYADCKYFDTEEKANFWIIENKPCLSIEEIAKIDLSTGKIGQPDFYGSLKELVKTKL